MKRASTRPFRAGVRTAGIHEARQHLTALLAEVRKGHQVIITDGG